VRVHPLIVVYNHPESGLTDAEVTATLVAHKYCLDHHFEPAWNATAAFVLGDLAHPTPRSKMIWEHHLLGTSDEAGALGYHFDDSGTPVMRTFVQTDKKYGLSWQVTFSHEVVEALVDPFCMTCAQDPRKDPAEFFGFEVGDPVEGDKFAYTYHDVEFTDFITPAWFSGDDGPYDFKHYCTQPFQVLEQGYCSIWKDGEWTSFQMQKGELVPTKDDDDVDKPRIRNTESRQLRVKDYGLLDG